MKNIPLIILVLLSIGCSSHRISTKKTHKNLRKLITTSPVFEQSFTGFALVDPSTNKTLVAVNANKHFTPASNTKILTLYTALKVLGDTLPAFQYVEKNDSLFILGTGDPTFLHRSFDNKALVSFLQKHKEQAYYIPPTFNEKKLGPGWAWDDYNDYYQVEKAALPIYGNVVSFDVKNVNFVSPSLFKDSLEITTNKTKRIIRAYSSNKFTLNKSFLNVHTTKEVPFIYSDQLALDLLNQNENVHIKKLAKTTLTLEDLKTVYITPKDTVLKRMMHVSDNFIAEQLLLMSSYQLFKEFNSKKTIQYLKDSLLNKSPSPLIWRDGSGLSRYNLLTPNSLVYVLTQIQSITSEKQLFELFPNGTTPALQHHYKDIALSIHAKTGSLSNNQCLSGYLKCKSGKILIFSFMHNNYIHSSSLLKKEMTKVLSQIISNY